LKLFLDANVLFTAAHNPKGKAAFVIDMAKEGPWEVVSSEFAIEEARRNLEIKFPKSLARLERLLRSVAVVPTVLEGDCPAGLAPKDRPILLSALLAECLHLLTGDRKHFGKLMNRPRSTGGVRIQTVSDFLVTLVN